jgi:hypothetical protein
MPPHEGYGSFPAFGLGAVVKIGSHVYAHVFTDGRAEEGPAGHWNWSDTLGSLKSLSIHPIFLKTTH